MAPDCRVWAMSRFCLQKETKGIKEEAFALAKFRDSLVSHFFLLLVDKIIFFEITNKGLRTLFVSLRKLTLEIVVTFQFISNTGMSFTKLEKNRNWKLYLCVFQGQSLFWTWKYNEGFHEELWNSQFMTFKHLAMRRGWQQQW